MPSLTIDLTDEEMKDLEEFLRHHPKEFKTPQDALRRMSGIGMYRSMKEKLDPKRKKAPAIPDEPVMILAQDLGIPQVYPCALNEILESKGKTYQEWISDSLEEGLKLVSKQLEDGKYEKTNEGVIINETPELKKWADEHPGVVIIGEVNDADAVRQ